jgi:hypothetical protein
MARRRLHPQPPFFVSFQQDSSYWRFNLIGRASIVLTGARRAWACNLPNGLRGNAAQRRVGSCPLFCLGDLAATLDSHRFHPIAVP